MPIQDVNIEELKKKGWKQFRTQIGEDGEIQIHPDDWDEFEKWANAPLTEKERTHLEHCREVYKKIKPRGYLSTEKGGKT